MKRPNPVSTSYAEHFRDAPTCTAYAPGRINIIGEHTDHAAGLAMPTAIDRGTWISLGPGKETEVYSLHHQERWSIKSGVTTDEPSWFTYVRGCTEALERQGHRVGNFRAAIGGDLPLGSGLSSSASLLVALLVGLRHLFEFDLDDRALLHTCRRVETQWLGVPCGLLDPLASLHSSENHVLLVDFSTEEWSEIPWCLKEWRWVAAHSGVARRLGESGYADRVEACKVAFETMSASHPSLSRWSDVQPEHLGVLDAVLRRRARHVITENERVMSAARALSRGDADGLGTLLLQSHASLRDDFAVSIAELDHLVRAAQEVPGCVGSRMMGGGFGGCTLNLVHRDAVREFSSRLENANGSSPPVFALNPAGGATIL